MRDDRPVMRRFDADILPLHLIADLDADTLGAHFQRPPFVLESVLAVLHFLLEGIRGVRTAGRHRDRKVPVMAERRKGHSQNRRAREVQLSAVDAHLVKPKFAVPAQVRIHYGNRRMHGRSKRREQHLVRPVVCDRVGLHSAANQVLRGFPFRPAPDDIPAERNNLPWFKLGRPGGNLLGVFLHELLHTRLKRFTDGA